MLDVFAKYAVDLDAEVAGSWKDLGGGAKILIARSGNEDFNKAVSAEYVKHRDALEKKGEKADKLAESLILDVYADTLVLGWEGIAFKGKPLEYTKSNVKMLLGLPEMKELRLEILNFAGDFNNYRVKLEEDQTKNS